MNVVLPCIQERELTDEQPVHSQPLNRIKEFFSEATAKCQETGEIFLLKHPGNETK